MRRRTLKVVTTFGGFSLPLGEFLIDSLASMYDYTKATRLVCPKCGLEPDRQPPYYCRECGVSYTSWSQLKRVTKDTHREFKKERLLPPKTQAVASIYRMTTAEFGEKYADATLSEAGITVKDPNSAMNLMKLVVAVERLNEVIILRWNDTYEERIALLTLSPSGRILLKEVIPMNLLRMKETLKVDMEKITEKDITEAQMLIGQIPMATDEVMTVSDFRTLGLEQVPTEAIPTPKVQELSQILAQIKQQGTA